MPHSTSSGLAASGVSTPGLQQGFPRRRVAGVAQHTVWRLPAGLRAGGPDMRHRPPDRRVVQGAGFDTEPVAVTRATVEQPRPALRAEIAIHYPAGRGVTLPALHRPLQQRQLRRSQPQRHAESTGRLALAFAAMASKHSEHFAVDAVAHGAALALAFQGLHRLSPGQKGILARATNVALEQAVQYRLCRQPARSGLNDLAQQAANGP